MRTFSSILFFIFCLLASASAQPIGQNIGGSIGSFDGGISYGGGATVNVNCPQGATYVAALSGLSGTQSTAYKTAICTLQAYGLFQGTLDFLYIQANAVVANAYVNAVNPGTYNLTTHGTVTFTANQGVAGDSSTGYLSSTFDPATAGGHMTQNSTTYGVCVRNRSPNTGNASTDYGVIDASNNGVYWIPFYTTFTGGALNDAGSLTTSSLINNAIGSWVITRTAAATATIYLNGSAQATNTTTSTGLPNATLVELARNNNGTIDSFTGDQVAYWFGGVGLNASQVNIIYTVLGNMMFALADTSSCAVASPVGSAQNYFFNSTTGADTNNCLFASGTAPNGPCLTITRANQLPNYGGGSMTFVGTFTGCLIQSQRNVSNPAAGSITITMTGATLTSNCPGSNSGSSGPKSAAIIIDSINAILNGGTIRGSGLTLGTATQYGVVAQNSSGGTTPTITLENLDIQGFGVVSLSTDAGADIFASGFSEAAGFPVACGAVNVTTLNVTLHGTSVTSGENNGQYGTGCSNAVLLSVQGTIANTISGIASDSLSGNGVLMSQGGDSALTVGTMQYTLAHDIGGNGTTCGGPVGLWTFEASLPVIQFTESYNVQSSTGSLPGGACDFSGYDFDIGLYGGVNQYVYSHNNGGPGFVIYNGSDSSTYRYSISENDAKYVEDGGGVYSVGSGNVGSSWHGYNLTIFMSYNLPSNSTPPACLSLGFSGTYTGGLWANNICYNGATDEFGRTYMLQGGAGPTGESSITMVNNDYYNAGGTLTFAANWNGNGNNYATLGAFQTGTSSETNSITSNPSPTSWAASGTCTWTPSSTSSWPPSGCPSTYSSIAAAVKSVGANLASLYPGYFVAPYPTNQGVRDYYANTTPGTGPCFNMGAYGVCP